MHGKRRLLIIGALILLLLLALQGIIIYRQHAIISTLNQSETGSNAYRHKLEIYIPSTIHADQVFDSGAIAEKILLDLAKYFRGASAQEIRGCWIMKNGTAVPEKIVICFVYCTDGELEQGKALFRKLAGELKETLNQESVAIVIDGTMEFI